MLAGTLQLHHRVPTIKSESAIDPAASPVQHQLKIIPVKPLRSRAPTVTVTLRNRNSTDSSALTVLKLPLPGSSCTATWITREYHHG